MERGTTNRSRRVVAAAALVLTLGSIATLSARAQESVDDFGADAVAQEEAPSNASPSAEAGDATPDESEAEPYLLLDQGTIEVVPGPDYEAGGLKAWFLGRDYRQIWTMELEVPVIDLERTAGGLTPIEKGGGMQTTSLHMRGEDGNEYHLRSVNKTAERSMPKGFGNTFVQSIVQDQISSINPLGSLILPPLAEAAGVLHTQPALVVIPDSPRLGEYREEFAGMLVQFERKPDEDQSDEARFGYSENIVSSETMFEEILDDNDNFVDERAFARARLFDMLIGDWDRHDDQWRWAEFESEHGTRFVPVPKDRDFAFAKFDGLLNRIGRLAGGTMMRRLVNFDEDVSDVVGLNWQGSELDKRLTASLTRDDWIEIADSLKAAVTDEVIESAVRTWPEEVFAEIGPMTINDLKSRRDDLPEVAAQYYEKLAVQVDVVGTNKHERFAVTRLDGGATRVEIYKTDKDGEVDRKLYERTFHPSETDELRLYGFDGNDQFIVDGKADKGLLVRAIGGRGDDRFADDSRVSGLSRLTRFYDTNETTEIETGPETRTRFSSDLNVNRYEMERFDFHSTGPIAAFDFNTRDGLFLGAGVHLTRSGFRREPYAARHALGVNYAPRTRAWNAFYEGHIVDVWSGVDFRLTADALAEYAFRDFYGLGNETPEEARFGFGAELRSLSAAPYVRRDFGKASYVEAGPKAAFWSIEPRDGLNPGDAGVGLTAEQLTDKYYAGFASEFAIDSRDSVLNPQRGLYWFTEADFSAGVRHTSARLARLASELRFYYTLPVPGQFTLALRAGGATNVGDFEFFQANTLGGSENLRGYPRMRFAGRSSAFGNAELRAKLFDFNLYLTRGELGLFGFYDQGRVWADDENSDLWHNGYGAGLWVTPFHLAVLSGAVTFSEEGTGLDFSLGFQF